jgi:hypothetical protein
MRSSSVSAAETMPPHLGRGVMHPECPLPAQLISDTHWECPACGRSGDLRAVENLWPD